MSEMRRGTTQQAVAWAQAAIVTARTVGQIHAAPLPPQPDVTLTRHQKNSEETRLTPTIPSSQQINRQASDWEKIRQQLQRREGMERGRQLQEPSTREVRPLRKRSR